MQTLSTIGGVLFTACAIVALWWGWRSPQVGGTCRCIAAALVAASIACWVRGFGAEIGVPLLLETWALAGFAFILTRLEKRPERTERSRIVAGPAVRRRFGRGAVQVAIAGPLGFAAAIGIGAAIATRAPLAEQTRLIGAGLLVPSLWAGFVGWTLVARRLPIPAASMAVASGAGFGLALLGQA